MKDQSDTNESTAIQRLREEAARNDRVIAQDLFLHGRGPEALAYLGRAQNYDPGSILAPELAVGMLNCWEHPVPCSICIGHQARVTAAQFSPDNARIVTASEDKTARVWDAPTGRLLATLLGHTEPLETAQFSPDGQRIVSTSEDNTARVWETQSGRLLATFPPTGSITRAVFSARGLEVLTTSEDAAQLWSVDEGRLLTTLPHPGGWPDAHLSPDGDKVLTTAREEERVAWIWDARTGQRLTTLVGHEARLTDARFSPDGQQIVTVSADGTARLWQARDGRLLATLLHGVMVGSGEFSPDGTRVLTLAADKAARVWQGNDAKLLATLPHTKGVHRAGFSADGRQVRTVTEDGTACFWDAGTGALLLKLVLTGCDARHTTDCIRFSPDGRWVVARSADDTARVWEVGAQSLSVRLGTHSRFAQFTPDGRRLLTACGDARLWDVADGKPLVTLGHEGDSHESGLRFSRVSFSPDSQRVLVILAGRDDPGAQIQDVKTGSPLMTLQGHQGAVRDARFSPDGLRVATASADRTVRIWDAASGHLQATLVHEEEVCTVWFSPDSCRLASCSGEKAVHLWEVATGRLLGQLLGHEGGLTHLGFSPDSRRVVTACTEDGTVRLWDATDGRLQLTVPVEDMPRLAQLSPDGRRLLTASFSDVQVWDAAGGRLLHGLCRGRLMGSDLGACFSPDGQRVAVTSLFDHAVRVWDTESGDPLALLLGHTDDVLGAQFSPDGHQLVTTSHDQTVRIWELLGATLPPPAWFTDFLRLMAQRRFNDDGELVQLGTDELLALRAKLAPVIREERSRYAAIARWILSPSRERPHRPGNE